MSTLGSPGISGKKFKKQKNQQTVDTWGPDQVKGIKILHGVVQVLLFFKTTLLILVYNQLKNCVYDPIAHSPLPLISSLL